MKQIFLVGPMGSGKSTIGKLIAKQLNVPFVDTDERISMEQQGTSIAALFEEQGEDFFRLQEQLVVERFNNGVIATGGGLPVYNNLMDELLDKGTVIYLAVSLESAMQRIATDTSRPLLPVDDEEKKKRWEALLAERASIYKQAHFTVDANQTSELVLKNIMNLLQKY
jgi:shikimate kinase